MLSIQQLNNGEKDLNHVADFATTKELVVTDRNGNTKPSLQGVIADLKAFNMRGPWSALTEYKLKDVVSYNGLAYVAILDHVSGAVFDSDLTLGKLAIYQGVTVNDVELIQKNSRKSMAGGSSIGTYPAIGVVAHVGDSNTQARPGYRDAYSADWFGKLGCFNGWTSYNMGANGSSLSVWASNIAAGDKNQIPLDYSPSVAGPSNPWQVINSNPTIIIFSLGTNDVRKNYSESIKTEFRKNMDSLINLFLNKTSADIVLRMPPPIAYENPDVNGFTDCISTNDAATRSECIRSIYLEWVNISGRVFVVDLHAALFGKKIDSIDTLIDVSSGKKLMSDSLHPTPIGFMRSVQIMSKFFSKDTVYNTKTITLGKARDASPIFLNAHWARTVSVLESGSNFLRIARNPLDFFGDSDKDSETRSSLKNIPFIESAMYFGNLCTLQDLKKLGIFYIYFHETGSTFGPLNSIGYNVDRPANADYQISPSGNFSGNKGAATIYVVNEKDMPATVKSGFVIDIQINGPQPLTVNAGGAVSLIKFRGDFSIESVVGFRDSNSGNAVVSLYIGNQVAGDFNSGSGNVSYPGLHIGDLNFSNGFRNSSFNGSAWILNSLNVNGKLPTSGVGAQIVARVTSGQIGMFGNISISCGT